VHATQVDTVVHAALVVNSEVAASARIHENNVIGTVNLLAAVAGEESPVRSVVVKSSTLVYGSSQRDPYFFREEDERTAPADTRLEQSLLEVEGYLKGFTEDYPGVRVAVLRFANVLGSNIVTTLTKALSRPLVPRVGGFDPQLQFVDEDDVVRALCFAVEHGGLHGIFNVAGPGRLPWSEVISMAGKQAILLPPVFTGAVAAPLRRTGLFSLPPETLDLLRFGRGVDGSRLQRAGFMYRFSTVGAVRHFVEGQRLKASIGEVEPAYRYEADVEAFFRHSPAVVNPV
jgi:UDP-glucose 4-epimerase